MFEVCFDFTSNKHALELLFEQGLKCRVMTNVTNKEHYIYYLTSTYFDLTGHLQGHHLILQEGHQEYCTCWILKSTNKYVMPPPPHEIEENPYVRSILHRVYIRVYYILM